MNIELLINIIYNTALLLALCVIYAIIEPKTIKLEGRKNIVSGVVLGLVGIAIMLNPYVLMPGLVFDVRSVLISVTAMFMGVVPVSIVAVMTIAFRVYMGGSGISPGVSVILVSAAIGLIWRHFRLRKVAGMKRRRLLELYLVGLAVHIAMLLCMFTLPWGDAVTALQNISLPVMLIYPVATVILGMLLFRQLDRAGIMAQLEENESLYRSLFENYHSIMVLFRPGTREIVDANPAACSYYGWTREKMKTMSMTDINTETPEEVDAKVSVAGAENRHQLFFRHRLSSGEEREVEVHGGYIRVKGEDLYLIVVNDITDRKIAQQKLEESEERMKVTLLSVGEGVITTDDEGIITLINRTAQTIVGCTDDIVGQPINSILQLADERTGETVSDPVKKVIDTGYTVGLANHTVLISRDGTRKMIEDSAAPIKDDDGNLMGVVFVFRDVTEEKRKQQQIKYLSYHDSLTGLFNRSFFDEEISRLDTARNLPMSVIVGDVNGLKLTNDAFGHDTGDQLLKDMAGQIKKACRKDDIIARWGGDEFIILLPKTNEKSAERVCERIKANCARVKMSEINFSISLGYDTKNAAEESIYDVLKSAELYMYRKKYLESTSTRGKTVYTILSALHEKNPREQQHSKRVSALCVGIAKAMGMSAREVNELQLIGMMHDIGKIALSDRILNKKGTLSNKEIAELKRHPEIGYRILSSSNDMAYIADYVLKHHERPDGTGYPNGLKGDMIPLESRIVAVADAYDAMTSERPYKEEMTTAMAIKELRKHGGKQFDADIVEIFVKEVLGK